MTEHTIVVFGAGHLTVEPALRASGVRARVLHCAPMITPDDGLTLIAVGLEGGADLARWIDAHGLDGVRGIGLVGVTAPCAERVPTYHAACSIPGCDHEESEALPLGPLEPLREVAERARRGDECTTDGCGAVHHEYPVYCDECNMGQTFALKFVVACTPDDGVCRTCGGMGRVPCDASNCIGADHECDVCNGTGKVLSSADVAAELVDKLGVLRPNVGGASLFEYPSGAALTEHGLRAVIENLTR